MSDDQWREAIKQAESRKGSVTPSTALLNQRLATFSKPRMLTQSEIVLLRQSKKEIGEAVRQRIDAWRKGRNQT